jgi:hypothetical protein
MPILDILTATDIATAALERSRNTPPDHVASGDNEADKPETFDTAPYDCDLDKWQRLCIADFIEADPGRLENYTQAIASTRIEAQIHAALIAGDLTEIGRIVRDAAYNEMRDDINKMLLREWQAEQEHVPVADDGVDYTQGAA